MRALAIAALARIDTDNRAENDCPTGTPLGVSRWDSMETHASGTNGTGGTRGTVERGGTVAGHLLEGERAAIAVELGKVPPVYADAFARLQCQRLTGIPHDWQARTADMAGQLLDRHGAALVTLGWPVAAIFDSPLVLATAGTSAALDLRRAGLVWQMREGDTIERLTPDCALIRCGDGREWTFHRGTH